MRNIAVILSCTLALAGCASAPDDVVECKSADWYRIGVRDGNAARPSRLEAHATACAPHGVKPDADSYAKGHAEGRATHDAVTAQRRMSLF